MTDKPLTAAELIQALSAIDPGTLIYWCESDMDYDRWFEYGVEGVAVNGELYPSTILRSGKISDEEDE